ncbi:hypothetical protein DFH07DRAFT_765772 [Mycena maculata]|uniref:Uncharacterized protein n=1 Tax=Mycena maculata TaxID=230809 RepID=A0AAD7K6R8_9AGAR|nr:hypothetical protein DFH07DRAFT_765772 [Mycena maculata]
MKRNLQSDDEEDTSEQDGDAMDGDDAMEDLRTIDFENMHDIVLSGFEVTTSYSTLSRADGQNSGQCRGLVRESWARPWAHRFHEHRRRAVLCLKKSEVESAAVMTPEFAAPPSTSSSHPTHSLPPAPYPCSSLPPSVFTCTSALSSLYGRSPLVSHATHGVTVRYMRAAVRRVCRSPCVGGRRPGCEREELRGAEGRPEKH